MVNSSSFSWSRLAEPAGTVSAHHRRRSRECSCAHEAARTRDSGVLPLVVRAEQAGEDGGRIYLVRHRRGWRSPGDIGDVGAAVSRIAFAGHAAFVHPQLERREARFDADLLGRELVAETPR